MFLGLYLVVGGVAQSDCGQKKRQGFYPAVAGTNRRRKNQFFKAMVVSEKALEPGFILQKLGAALSPSTEVGPYPYLSALT